MTRGLAWAAGGAGLTTGFVLWREGTILWAVVAWVLTLCVAVLLTVAGMLLDAITTLLARTAALESDVRILLGRDRHPTAHESVEVPPNPWHDH